MEKITINDLAKAIDEIRDRLTDSQGWSTSTMIISIVIAISIALFVYFVISSITKIQKEMEDVKKDISKISNNTENLDFIKKFINLFYKNEGIELTTINSPITLNERGVEISKKIQADNIINRNYETFKNNVCEKEVINAYDIQQNCFSFSKSIIKTKEYFEDNEYENMKSIAFDEGITIESIYIVFGILLRDRILQERQLTHDDIDKHDPGTTNQDE